ncbi:MAG: sigma 54-interacting transcriptional regulator [Bacteroidia bacterium]|nr:sigma 54-interacting transcriptional regulator [Bacteroidia bacterium]
MKKDPKHKLLTWHALAHGVIVTARCLNLLWKEEGIRISEVVYLQNSDLTDKDVSELQYLSRLNQGTRGENLLRDSEEFIQVCADFQDSGPSPRILQKRLNLASPTDYESIWKSVRGLLDTLGGLTHDQIQYHINLSPGTPQMHVVWLMLNSGGHLPDNTRLWSTQIDRKTNRTFLDEIKFKPKAYLSEVFEKKLRIGKQLNDETKLSSSGKRYQAIEQLLTFAMVPAAPILVLGERGVGKSTLIKERLEETKTGFVEIACGTFSDELFRSEMFGHQKGSFSGALENKEGLIEKIAKGGILFLDEIQDLSKLNQRLLLQILQEQIYYPIGAENPRKANFRIICATNFSLPSLLASDRLDLDFFDRISRFMVQIPALRDCPEDLPIIWETTWRNVTSFDPTLSEIRFDKVKDQLSGFTLIGNIRDLERVASLILVGKIKKKSDRTAISSAFEEFDRFEKMKKNNEPSEAGAFFQRGNTHKEIMVSFKQEFYKWAIITYGSVAKAAKELEVAENTIRGMK